jgi:hypothetical protein
MTNAQRLDSEEGVIAKVREEERNLACKELARAVESFMRRGGYNPARAREVLEQELARLEKLQAAHEAGKKAAQAKLAEMGWEGPLPEQWR